LRTKRLLKFLDDAKRVLGKLVKVANKAYQLAKLLHELYKIVAHL
jgi:hypothetical protein